MGHLLLIVTIVFIAILVLGMIIEIDLILVASLSYRLFLKLVRLVLKGV